MPVGVGDQAPDFSLPFEASPERVTLSGFRGRPVVVLFFPLAFSPRCMDEMCTVAEDFAAWTELDAQVLGISVDSPYVVQRFAAACDAEFPMLSDFNREAVDAFGVRDDDFYGLKGVAYRSVFVVDPQGRVAYVWVTEDASVLPDFDIIRDVVRSVGQTPA
jgi:peroxiredoxin